MRNFFEFYNFFIYFLVLLFVSCFILILNKFLVVKTIFYEKTTQYECGFQPFSKIIKNFEIKYYVVGILFLLFDIELLFLFPYIACFYNLNSISLFLIIFFFFYWLPASFMSIAKELLTEIINA